MIKKKNVFFIIIFIKILILIILNFIKDKKYKINEINFIDCETIKKDIIIHNDHIFDKEIQKSIRKTWGIQKYTSISYKNNIKKLKYCLVTNYGRIYDYKNNIGYINGTCKPQNMDINSLIKELNNTSNIKSNVITISTKWGNAIWHFPFESLVALRLLLKTYKNLDQYYLHIDTKSNYHKQWFEIVNIPIKWENVIYGNTKCENLIVCQVDQCCNPSIDSINWLKNRLNIKKTNYQDTIIIIKRCYNRKLKNFDELYKYFIKLPQLNKYKLYIHDDSKLPPLKQQMETFNRAKLVIGPHGAGGINLISCKENTNFIELMDKSHTNLCFARLAVILKLNYYCIHTNNFFVNIDNIKSIVNKIDL